MLFLNKLDEPFDEAERVLNDTLIMKSTSRINAGPEWLADLEDKDRRGSRGVRHSHHVGIQRALSGCDASWARRGCLALSHTPPSPPTEGPPSERPLSPRWIMQVITIAFDRDSIRIRLHSHCMSLPRWIYDRKWRHKTQSGKQISTYRITVGYVTAAASSRFSCLASAP